MQQLHRNVWLLSVSQALVMSVNSLVVFVGGIVGTTLAPSEQLATLPVATIIIGTAVTVVPVTLFMRKAGRKKVFLLIMIYSILVSFLAAYAISTKEFTCFV